MYCYNNDNDRINQLLCLFTDTEFCDIQYIVALQVSLLIVDEIRALEGI